MPFPRSQLHQRRVDGNAVQPGTESRFTPEGREPLPGPDKDVLHQLIRAALVADHAPHQRVHPRHVRPVEPLEGLLVSGRGQRDVGALAVGVGQVVRRRRRIQARLHAEQGSCHDTI